MVKISRPVLIKIGKYFLIFLGVVLFITAGFYLYRIYGWKLSLLGKDSSCFRIEEHKIVGHSLEPSLKEGIQVKGLIGYYDCNKIKRGEIAIIKFKTREETFVKKIVGVPGDKLEFVDLTGSPQANQLKLNGKILKNSLDEPYLFSETGQRIITIPLKDGKIPEGRYFVLSEEKGLSSFDSRQYGFLEKEHLKGRIIK